jgi:uridine kinase
MRSSEDILTKISSLPKPAIVGISGFGGSGKSTIAAQLGKELCAPVVGVDSFQKKGAFTTTFSMWNIMDFKRLEKEVLEPFSKGLDVTYRHFDAEKEILLNTVTIPNKGMLIVEGVGLFRPELLKYFSYKIWIDMPIDMAIARGKKRDREEYGNPTDEQWDGVWKDNDLEYMRVCKPNEVADDLIDNSK